MQKSWSDPAPTPATTIPVYDAEALTGDNAVAQITLGDAVYTLRITRSYKLILTK
ncbi:MAG: hemin uptake protein HemP [Pseudomonadota bacterium]